MKGSEGFHKDKYDPKGIKGKISEGLIPRNGSKRYNNHQIHFSNSNICDLVW